MFGPVLTLAAYLLGSISFGLVLAARRGVDLRTIGSGNVGATNVARALGGSRGRLVMALDGLKGLAPALVARLLLGPADPWMAATGLAAVIGHVLPVWHGFRGGKGAATAAGVLLALVPPAGLAAIAAFVLLKRVSRRASVGSLGGALVGATVAFGWHGRSWTAWMALTLLAIVVLRHTDNLKRLWRGEEPPS